MDQLNSIVKKYGQNKPRLSSSFFTLEYRNCFSEKN